MTIKQFKLRIIIALALLWSFYFFLWTFHNGGFIDALKTGVVFAAIPVNSAKLLFLKIIFFSLIAVFISTLFLTIQGLQFLFMPNKLKSYKDKEVLGEDADYYEHQKDLALSESEDEQRR
jgi:hypothetical protein